MKILLINVHYGIGSTGKIIESIFSKLSNDKNELYCIYGRKSKISGNDHIIKKTFELESKIHHFFSLITENIYGGMFLSTLRIKRFIKKIRPDIVNIHCANGYFVNIYSLISYLKRKNIKTVITNHAEFMFTANCAYSYDCVKWMNEKCKKCANYKEFNGKYSLSTASINYSKMERAFKDFKNYSVTNVSPWLTSRSSKSSIFQYAKENDTIINPIGSVFFDVISEDNPYKKFNIKSNSKIVFFCTAYFKNKYKGGNFLYELAEMCKNENIIFFVKSGIPYYPTNISDNIIFINDSISQKELAQLYYNADCTLMLSKAETFSMVVGESLACGTPVVGFLSGGPETIAINGYSKFVDYGNVRELKAALISCLEKKYDKNKIRQVAYEKYNEDKIANQYLATYKKLIGNNNE